MQQEQPYKFFTGKDYVLKETAKSSIVKLGKNECIFMSNKLVKDSKSGKAKSFFIPRTFEFKLYTYKFEESGQVKAEEVKLSGDETEMVKADQVYNRIKEDNQQNNGFFVDGK